MPNEPVRRVTGSADIDISKQGDAQAAQMAAKLSHKFSVVFCGPESRMEETAKYFGDPIVLNGLDAWRRGLYEGMPAHAVKREMADLIAHDHRTPPGRSPISGQPGESYSAFYRTLLRIIQHIQKHLGKGERVLLITSGGGLQAINAWLSSGSPVDLNFDKSSVEKSPYWSRTGQLFMLGKKRLEPVASNQADGVYLCEHAATRFNPPKSPVTGKEVVTNGKAQDRTAVTGGAA